MAGIAGTTAGHPITDGNTGDIASDLDGDPGATVTKGNRGIQFGEDLFQGVSDPFLLLSGRTCVSFTWSDPVSDGPYPHAFRLWLASLSQSNLIRST